MDISHIRTGRERRGVRHPGLGRTALVGRGEGDGGLVLDSASLDVRERDGSRVLGEEGESERGRKGRA